MKKIRVLNAPLNEIKVGGLSTIEFRLGTNMEKEKVIVDFFATYKMEDNYYKDIVKSQDGQIYDFNINKKRNVLMRKMSLIKKFYKIIRKNKYDIIHLHIDSAFSGFILGFIAKIFTKNSIIIFHSHNTSISGLKKKIAHSLLKPFLGLIGDEFLTCSTEAANWMFPKYILKKKKIQMIENGINIESYLFNEETRKKYRHELDLENNFVIGHIGRFSTQKNHEFLIDIFNEVHNINKNAKLILVGIGNLQEIIKEKVKKYNLEEFVLFLDSRNDVNNLLQAFDVFLLPSLYEGLPIVAVEAQVAGLKTFLSDTISKETSILPNIDFISLDKSAEFWAKKILETGTYDRNEYKNIILESDFNIKKSALKLQKIYSKILLGE